MKTRFSEHTNMRSRTAVTEHLYLENHQANFDDVEFLAHGKSDKELLIKESLLVKKFSPRLNLNVQSYPLELF